MPSRTNLIRIGITVAVLVAALAVGSLFARSRQPSTPQVITLSAEDLSKQQYDEATALLSKEETAAAILLLENAVASNPNNAAATQKLAELKKSSGSGSTSSTTTSTGGTGGGGTGGADPYLGDIDLARIVPVSGADFNVGPPAVVAPDATVDGSPKSAANNITNINWAVHDLKDAAKAQAFINNVSKVLYPKDSATVNVKGITGYFGTDGMRLATISFVRGRYAFEVTVATTGRPAEVKAIAEKAAGEFPAAPTQ